MSKIQKIKAVAVVGLLALAFVTGLTSLALISGIIVGTDIGNLIGDKILK
jgi:hypothetical protein